MTLLAKAIAGWIAFAGSLRTGNASTFYAHEPTNNGWLQCRHRPMRDTDFGVALPVSYPCGTRVWLYAPRTGRAIVAVKVDVGPAHQLVDLTPAAARKLGSNGMEPVIMGLLP